MSCFVDACPSQAVTGEIDPLRGLRPARLVLASGRVLAWWREARRSFVIYALPQGCLGLGCKSRQESGARSPDPSQIHLGFRCLGAQHDSLRVAPERVSITCVPRASVNLIITAPTRLLTPLPNRRDQSNQEVQGAEIVRSRFAQRSMDHLFRLSEHQEPLPRPAVRHPAWQAEGCAARQAQGKQRHTP